MIKKECRDQARKRRKDFFTGQSQESLEELEWKRIENLLKLNEIQNTLKEGARVAVYHTMGDEASTARLIETLHKNNIPMALPKVMEGSLIFQTYTLGDELIRSPFGVLEALVNAPPVTPSLYIVPLLAFDDHNHRLGYGKGHYDRYFAQCPQGLKVGWAYECQRIDSLKIEHHDVPLDYIVTDLKA